MNFISFDIVLEKIRENKTPYWRLFFDMGGQRATQPCDYFDPQQVTDDNLDEKINASVEKLKHVMDGYMKVFAGRKYFHIVMKPNVRANGETARFDYAFFIEGKGTEGTQQSLQGLPAMAANLGMVSKDVLDQKLELVKQQMQIEWMQKELEKKEQKLAEREKEIDSDANTMAKGMKKALMGIYNTIIDDDEMELKGIPGKDDEEADDEKTKATEELAEFVYNNFKSDKDVKNLLKIVKDYVNKKQTDQSQPQP